MVREPVNLAASVKQRLLNIARAEQRVYEVVLVRYALERLLWRLSVSDQRDRFILKGGMLVTQWLESGLRETRDADFLGHGDSGPEALKAVFAGIMAIAGEDGLEFDVERLTAEPIREELEYGGVRLKTSAYLEKTRIPVTLDIGFGDALADAPREIDYPTLLGMPSPSIRTYSPAAVIAEKFQAMVILGVANGRMKDYHDLWAIPQAIAVTPAELDPAIAATFERRRTDIPAGRPAGLSSEFVADQAKQRQWRAYATSIELKGVTLEEVVEAAWALVGPSCARIARS